MDYIVDTIGASDPPGITPDNLLVGRARFRQVRVRPGPCTASRWEQLAARFSVCYGFYDVASEERAPFGPGPSGGDAWTYRVNDDGNPSYGYLYTYYGNGYWIDLSRDTEAARAEVAALKVKVCSPC